MRRSYRQPSRPPFITRRLNGQLIIGEQTRNLTMNDRVLVARDGQEYIAHIVRHQGDLIYLIQAEDLEPVWLHAKYIVAKIIWPKQAAD